MNQTPVKTHRKFDETFKREAVQNWRNSSKSAEVIAQELGINAHRLYAWQKRFAPAAAGGRAATGPQPGSVADLQAQLAAARRGQDRWRRRFGCWPAKGGVRVRFRATVR